MKSVLKQHGERSSQLSNMSPSEAPQTRLWRDSLSVNDAIVSGAVPLIAAFDTYLNKYIYDK